LKDEITRFYSLDILRGIAAIAVVLYHWRHFFGSNLPHSQKIDVMKMPFADWSSLIYVHGHLAVDLFFCLSGFIFYFLYSKPIVSGNISPSNFFWLRFTRLYPLHLVTLLTVYIGQSAFYYAHGDFF
jgi:peptidoglycan/LPS O-acetylase OafA/YrhL